MLSSRCSCLGAARAQFWYTIFQNARWLRMREAATACPRPDADASCPSKEKAPTMSGLKSLGEEITDLVVAQGATRWEAFWYNRYQKSKPRIRLAACATEPAVSHEKANSASSVQCAAPDRDIGRGRRGLPPDLAARTGLAPSTVHRLLTTLESGASLVRRPDTTWQIGAKSYLLGSCCSFTGILDFGVLSNPKFAHEARERTSGPAYERRSGL